MWAAETRDRGWEKSTVSYLDDRTKGGLYFNHYLVKMQVHSTYSHFAEMEITIHLRCLLFGTFFQILGPIYFHSIPKRQAGLAVGWWYYPLFIDEMKSPGAFWEQIVWRPYLEIPFWNKILEPRGCGHRSPFLGFLQYSRHSQMSFPTV